MANVYAVASGNWSNPATWNTGTLPTSSDDVFANNFNVTIDQDITVLSIRTVRLQNIEAGGSFTLQEGRTVNANIIAGTTSCLLFSAKGIVTINGSCTGGAGHAVWITATSAVININGNCIGGSSRSAAGVMLNGTECVLNLKGDATGGTATGTHAGVYIASSTSSFIMTGNVYGSASSYGIYVSTAIPKMDITGNVTGGSGVACYGLYVNVSGAFVTINGNVTGGTGSTSYGVYNNAISTINIRGTVEGSTTSIGAVNVSTGTLRCILARAHSNAAVAGLSGSSINGITTWERLDFGSNGSAPVSGFTKMSRSEELNYVTVKRDDGVIKNLVDSDQLQLGMPSPSDVRAGVVYDNGNKTGKCAVPLASQVSVGVPVDNTVGTAVLTAAGAKAAILDADVSTLTVSNSIGERLKNCSTVETTGAQITSLNP